MKYKEIIQRASNDLNIPYDIVDKTYKSYWYVIRNFLSSVTLYNNITKDEFSSMKTSVNIPSIGKIYCDYNRYLNKVRRLEYNKLNNNAKYKKN